MTLNGDQYNSRMAREKIIAERDRILAEADQLGKKASDD